MSRQPYAIFSIVVPPYSFGEHAYCADHGSRMRFNGTVVQFRNNTAVALEVVVRRAVKVGSRKPRLLPAVVAEILADGRPPRELAEHHNVALCTITRIKSGHTRLASAILEQQQRMGDEHAGDG